MHRQRIHAQYHVTHGTHQKSPDIEGHLHQLTWSEDSRIGFASRQRARTNYTDT